MSPGRGRCTREPRTRADSPPLDVCLGAAARSCLTIAARWHGRRHRLSHQIWQSHPALVHAGTSMRSPPARIVAVHRWRRLHWPTEACALPATSHAAWARLPYKFSLSPHEDAARCACTSLTAAAQHLASAAHTLRIIRWGKGKML
jgi:hypothetical protein